MARTERGPSTSDSDSGQHLRTQISLQPNAKMKLRPSSRTNFKVSYFHSLIHETYYPFRILPSVLYFLKSRSIKQEIHRGSHSPKVTLYFLKYTKISWMFRDFFCIFRYLVLNRVNHVRCNKDDYHHVSCLQKRNCLRNLNQAIVHPASNDMILLNYINNPIRDPRTEKLASQILDQAIWSGPWIPELDQSCQNKP